MIRHATLQKYQGYLISKSTLIVCKIDDGKKYMDNKICLVFFPTLRKTPLYFPIPRAPGPSPKKGCESPVPLPEPTNDLISQNINYHYHFIIVNKHKFCKTNFIT